MKSPVVVIPHSSSFMHLIRLLILWGPSTPVSSGPPPGASGSPMAVISSANRLTRSVPCSRPHAPPLHPRMTPPPPAPMSILSTILMVDDIYVASSSGVICLPSNKSGFQNSNPTPCAGLSLSSMEGVQLDAPTRTVIKLLPPEISNLGLDSSDHVLTVFSRNPPIAPFSSIPKLTP